MRVYTDIDCSNHAFNKIPDFIELNAGEFSQFELNYTTLVAEPSVQDCGYKSTVEMYDKAQSLPRWITSNVNLTTNEPSVISIAPKILA